MKNANSTTVTFDATLVELHPSGKAIKLANCKQGKELLFKEIYMPRSQSSLTVLNAKTKKVRVRIPEWLFDTKMDTYTEEQEFTTDDSVFDQLGFLSINDANQQFPDKQVDRLAEERPE